MKVLLDTNIVIHREAPRGVNQGIGVLYRWLDNLHYSKCIHPVTVKEIDKLRPSDTKDTFQVKLTSYNVLKVTSALHPDVQAACDPLDTNENDRNDTLLLNEVYNDRVDLLITEDKKIRRKARLLGIESRVYKIDAFLEKVTAENPGLVDYKVLSVRKELFGDVNVNDGFFDSLKADYPAFQGWFNGKSEDEAYVCRAEEGITAFLYLKREEASEPYPDIEPHFLRKRRLKIGTLKVTYNGYKLGERFLKIVFDNALRLRVDEIYVTVYDRTDEQRRLIDLLKLYGFLEYGTKRNDRDQELVYVRDMTRAVNLENPKLTFPYISQGARVFLVPIYPEYHTSLFPDSILRTESAFDFVEHEPFRNAISKVYISRSYERSLTRGDVIVFYRTGGFYKGVATTVGIVEGVVTGIANENDFVQLCRKRSVFSDQELLKHWNHSTNRPFIVNFLYTYSFPKRPNLERLIEMGIISDVNSVPRGFRQISQDQFAAILQEAEVNDRIVVD